MLLVITLILTIHQARGCVAPPNLKNSTSLKNRHQINNNVKGTIILHIFNSIIINKKLNNYFI